MPRNVCASNNNAQNLNAKALLRRWRFENMTADVCHYGKPAAELADREQIHLHRLWRWRFWRMRLTLLYLNRYDGIFYPGGDKADIAGLRARKAIGLRSPVIATMEGLMGDSERERYYSALAGHAVYCQNAGSQSLRRSDYLLKSADHIIAISPFLAEMGRMRFGDKFSVLPLGVDRHIFYREDWTAAREAPGDIGRNAQREQAAGTFPGTCQSHSAGRVHMVRGWAPPSSSDLRGIRSWIG